MGWDVRSRCKTALRRWRHGLSRYFGQIAMLGAFVGYRMRANWTGHYGAGGHAWNFLAFWGISNGEFVPVDWLFWALLARKPSL